MDSATMPKNADQAPAAQENAQENAQGNVAERSIAVRNNRLESRELFVGTKELTIGHEGEVYRLRLTALNKLILTK